MSKGAEVLADVGVERAVLGACMSGSAVGDVDLPPAAFTDSRRHVWEAMQALHAAGSAVDHLTVSEKLKARGRLAECGGPGMLMELDSATPVAHNLPTWVQILRDRMERREIVAALEQARQRVMDLGAKPVVVAGNAAAQLSAIRAPTTLRRSGVLITRLIDKWAANLDAHAAGGEPVVPGLSWPHEAMEGDLVPYGRLTAVAGRSGNFKSGLVTDGMRHWAAQGIQGGVIGLEDGCDWFSDRLAGRAVGVPYEQVGYARLNEHQQMRLGDWSPAEYDLLEANVFHEDYSEMGDASADITFPEVFATVKRMVEGGARWIVIDHGLQINWMPGSGVDRMDLAIGVGLKRLSRYAERTGVAVIILWHLNRASEEGTFPKRSDLKESSYLDAAARKIYVLWKQEHRPGFQLVTTVKATRGKEGRTAALSMVEAQYGLLARKHGYVVDFEKEAADKRERELAEKRARKQSTAAGSYFGKNRMSP